MSVDKDAIQRKKRSLSLIPWIVLVVGCSVWATWFAYAAANNGPVWRTKAGQFGDSFGAINTLFTMAAMIGAAFAVYLQRYELEREKEHRMDDVTKQEAEQREARFFQLIKLLGDASDRVQVRGVDIERKLYISGHRAFVLATNRLESSGGENQISPQEAMRGCDQWVTMLTAIITYVNSSPDQEQRSFFQSVVRSQLSVAQIEFVTLVSVEVADDYPLLKANLQSCELWDKTYKPLA